MKCQGFDGNVGPSDEYQLSVSKRDLKAIRTNRFNDLVSVILKTVDCLMKVILMKKIELVIHVCWHSWPKIMLLV